MKKNNIKKLKLLLLLFVSVNLLNFTQKTNAASIVPEYGNYAFMRSDYDFLQNYIDYTLENGIHAVKNRKGTASNSIPIMLYSNDNNTLKPDIVFHELMFDLQLLKHELDKENFISIRFLITYNFYGTMQTKAFTTDIMKKNNDSYGLTFVHRDSCFLDITPYMTSEWLSLLLYADMCVIPSENLNRGCLYTKTVVSNSSSEYEIIDTFRHLGASNGYPDHCDIASSSLEICFYPRLIPWENTFTNLQENPLKFARSLTCLITNPSDIILPDREIFAENLQSKTIDILEPNLETETYWNYTGFNLEIQTTENFMFSRNYTEYNETNTFEKTYSFNYNFSLYYVKSQTNKFYYSTQTIKPSDWGNWVIRIRALGGLIDYEMSFNWFRDLIVQFLNTMIFLIQTVLYLLTIAFNYLIVWLFLQIIVLLWNYPIKWLVFSVIGVVFWISFFFVWLWNQIVILWKQVIEPMLVWIWNWIVENTSEFIEWLKTEGFIVIYAFFVVILSYIVSAILFVVCMGSVDYNTIFQFILQINSYILQIFIDFLMAFFGNFLVLLQAVALYFAIIGFLMLKLLYAKAKGYTSRVEKIQSAINFYKYPIDIIYRLLQTFLATKATENT